ncbi:MAG: DUF58 domain-containing protein [Streptosporangiaceae bacterium]
MTATPARPAGTAAAPAGRRRCVPVTWHLSGLARSLITLALAALFLAVVTRRPEFAGVAAPAVLVLLRRSRGLPAEVGVTLAADGGSLVEGDESALLVKVDGQDGAAVRPRLHPSAWITAGAARSGDGGWFLVPFLARHWGSRPPGRLELILHDRWRLAEGRAWLSLPAVSCLPRPASLQSMVVLSKLPARLGEHVARAAGEGTEFAGVREFVPGDRQRRINWPATTRRGTLQLNTFASERAQVTVLLMDVSTDIGSTGDSTADLAVRATIGVAARYLAARDRVGLVCFGRQLRWISPGTGRRQADRIMAMVTVETGDGEPLGSVTRLPAAALPPGALIIVVSPLLSLRLVEALRELRERGFATIVLDVLTAEPGIGSAWQRRRDRAMAGLARRIWRMEQDAIRFSLRELGIPVVGWDGHSSLDEPLAPYTRRGLVNQP